MAERFHRLATLALFTVLMANSSLAHAHDVEPQLFQRWTPQPWLWAGLLASAALYVRGRAVMVQRLGSASHRVRVQARYFVLSMASLVLALLSPLDALSDQLFWAHMVQHELLMLLAAPLLVLARPLETYYWALPVRARSWTLRFIRTRTFAAGFAMLTAPGVALLLHAAVRWVWHIPLLFEMCLHDEWLHGVQHATFFLSAMVFWWALLQGAHGRFGYGVAVLFVFATALHTGALGALLTFARAPWYADQTRPGVGLSPLADQQLAGFVMWIVAGTWLTGIGLALFTVWLGQLERRRRTVSSRA